MAKIRTYNFITADGFYAGLDDEIDWFTDERIHIDGRQDLDHLRPNVLSTLIFGKSTYEMMREYWSSAQAMEDDPKTTHKMRESPKIVISKTLEDSGESPTWKYVTLLRSIDPEYFRDLKENASQDMTILGSGTIVHQFLKSGLLDEIELMVVPVNLSAGKMLLSPEEISRLTATERLEYQNGIYSQTYSCNT